MAKAEEGPEGGWASSDVDGGDDDDEGPLVTARALETRRRFTTHRPSAVTKDAHGDALCWGWMLKQGAGGLLHRKNWKKRFFVLYRVPQAHVLVYYSSQAVTEEHLLGYIDLRRATQVESELRTVQRQERTVINVTTKSRVYNLVPLTINSVVPVPALPRVQYILGWPVREPTRGPELDCEESVEEGGVVLERWLQRIVVAVKTEREAVLFTAHLRRISLRTTFPEQVMVRVEATQLSILDCEDTTVALLCVLYSELKSWKLDGDELEVSMWQAEQSEEELVTGLTEQPSLELHTMTLHSEAASEIVRCISDHVKVLRVRLRSDASADSRSELPEDSPGEGSEGSGKSGAAAEAEAETEPQGEAGGEGSEVAAEAGSGPDAAEAGEGKGVSDDEAAYAGWRTYVDKKGRQFYANKATGETSWQWPPDV